MGFLEREKSRYHGCLSSQLNVKTINFEVQDLSTIPTADMSAFCENEPDIRSSRTPGKS